MIQVHLPANLFYPELPGGSLQYFRYAPFLHERGIRFTVHVARKPHHDESELEIANIRILRYEVPSGASLLQELEFLTERAMEAAKSSTYKVVIQPLGTAGASPRSLLRLWRARLLGIPSCFHFMDVPLRRHHRFPGNLSEILRMRIQLAPYGRLLMCSRVMGRAFQSYSGVSDRKLAVVPNGIDLSVFSPVPDDAKWALRKKLDLPADSPIVLYVGSVIARKGVDILIGAWEKVIARMPGARLVIVGSTGARPTVRDPGARSETEIYVSRIMDQIDRLDNPRSVIFAGEVDNVRDYYRACDLFAFASRHEGLPSVVMEAMACGVPCVVAPFVGLPLDGEEYGVAGKHFVKSAHDPAQMADDILRLMEDPDARAGMGKEAAEWIAETQEMGKAADILAGIYRELAGSR